MTTDCLGCYSELRRGRPETHKETRLPGDAALLLPESRLRVPPAERWDGGRGGSAERDAVARTSGSRGDTPA